MTEATTSLNPPTSLSDPPAARFGVTLVHAEQIAREQSRLVAPGAGAHFEHRRALVGGVARQQRERELAVGGFERGLVGAQFLLGHRAQFGIGILGHRREALRLLPQPADIGGRLGDRLELGIFLRHLDEALARQVAGRHQRGELVPPRFDLPNPFERDRGHAAVCCSKIVRACAAPANASSSSLKL